ncbi:hypothetical protein BST61_g1519 [Cercospora zeina]
MEELSLKTPRRFGGDTITINVGIDDNVETFIIHEPLLRERGGFFEAALNKQWKEGRARKIDLPEDQPDTVAAYIEWLYTKRIRPHTEKSRQQWEMCDAHNEYEHLAQLYIFGEKNQDSEFCNRCIDDTIETTKYEFVDADVDSDFCFYYPGNHTIKMIFQGTHTGSPIRSLCVDIYWQNAAEN